MVHKSYGKTELYIAKCYTLTATRKCEINEGSSPGGWSWLTYDNTKAQNQYSLSLNLLKHVHSPLMDSPESLRIFETDKYSQRLWRFPLHCWQQWQILPINEYKIKETLKIHQKLWIPLKCKNSQLVACHLQGLHKCIGWLHVFVVIGWGFPWVRRDYGTSSWQLEEIQLSKS